MNSARMCFPKRRASAAEEASFGCRRPKASESEGQSFGCRTGELREEQAMRLMPEGEAFRCRRQCLPMPKPAAQEQVRRHAGHSSARALRCLSELWVPKR